MSWPFSDLIPFEDIPEGFPHSDTVVVCTDGSGNAVTGLGSWAFVSRNRYGNVVESSEAAQGTTNNRMELMAIIQALEFFDPLVPLVIVSDSQYCVLGCARYVDAQRLSGWKKSDGKPVKNADLWERLWQAQNREDRHVHYHHVKGHKGHPGNERADALCTKAVQALKSALQNAPAN